MHYQAALSLALILTLSSSLFAHSAATTALPTKVVLRHYSFPSEYPLGSLKMIAHEPGLVQNRGSGIGPAQGSLSIAVPLGESILLDINPHCVEHPERLKEIKTDGINSVKIAYLSMDENDHSQCDKALRALPEFKDLIALNVERSDVTDKGLASFKSLPSVKYLSAFGSALDGSIFKETQKLKNVENVNLMFNPLKSENLKYLSALPHLTELWLNRSNLTDNDLSNLSKCTQLKRLHLCGNSKISDKSIPVLKQLTGLQVLDIQGTRISLAGLLVLKNLKLTRLTLTGARYRPSEVGELVKAFPKTFLDYRGAGIGVENAIFFAPLK